MRRMDRAVTEVTEIQSIMDRCEVARVGFCTDNQPYIVPMHFAYAYADGRFTLYFHCANEGRKRDMLAANDRVCFECDRLLATEPSEAACDWSARYESVMCEGRMEALTHDAEKRAALDLIMKRYGFAGQPVYKESAMKAVTVLKLTVTEITGKRG